MQSTSLRITEQIIPIKPVSFLHDEPFLKWTTTEVKRMNSIENLCYAVVGKFSYGWPEINEIRKLILNQCDIKGKVQIGLLRKIDMFSRIILMLCKMDLITLKLEMGMNIRREH